MKWLQNTVKIALAGALLFGIALFVIAQSPEDITPGVQEAQADIGAFFARDKDEEFSRIMIEAGFTPRSYDLNGNTMYFANAYSDLTPTQLIEHFQHEFHKRGINTENHSDLKPSMATSLALVASGGEMEIDEDDLEEFSEFTGAFANGEVVPVQHDQNHMAMGGVLLHDDLETVAGTLAEDGETRLRRTSVRSQIKGYRWIEAYWNPKTRTSDVTAVWTGRNFDANRLENRPGAQQSPPDPSVPSCMGCDRRFRMQSLDENEPFQSNFFITNVSVDRTFEFYQSSMINRGWTPTDGHKVMDRVASVLPDVAEIQNRGRIISMERDGQEMAIVVMPGVRPGQTNVLSLEQGPL